MGYRTVGLSAMAFSWLANRNAKNGVAQYFVDNTAFSVRQHIEYMIHGLGVIDKELPHIVSEREKMSDEEYKKERAKMHWLDQILNTDLDSWEEYYPGWEYGDNEEPVVWFYSIVKHAYAGIGLIFGRDVLFEDVQTKYGKSYCLHSEMKKYYDAKDNGYEVSFENLAEVLKVAVLDVKKTKREDEARSINTFSEFYWDKEDFINDLYFEEEDYKEEFTKRYKAARTEEELLEVHKEVVLDSQLKSFKKSKIPKDKWKPLYDKYEKLLMVEPYASPVTYKQLKDIRKIIKKLFDKYETSEK